MKINVSKFRRLHLAHETRGEQLRALSKQRWDLRDRLGIAEASISARLHPSLRDEFGSPDKWPEMMKWPVQDQKARGFDPREAEAAQAEREYLAILDVQHRALSDVHAKAGQWVTRMRQFVQAQGVML